MDIVNHNISIVITCYNYGHFVEGCLQSVFAQTYTDYEVILVDDGSTDDTEARVQPFIQKIKYIRQKNGGQANAKNRGVNEARGRFIAFLDADDLWQPDKLEKQIALFTDDKVGVVYSRQSFIDEQGQAVQRGRRRTTMLPKSGKVTADLFMDNFVPFSSSLVRSECFMKFGDFDESLAMGIDWDLWLRFSTGYYFSYMDEPLLIYRIGHSGQMSKNALKRQECSDRIMEKFRSTYPEEVPWLLDRRAMAFTYCNRGVYFRRKNLSLSTGYFFKALAQHPLWPAAYQGLLRNFLSSLLPVIKT